MSETPLERATDAVDEARAAKADALDAATHNTSELEQLTGGDARAQSRRTSDEPDDDPDSAGTPIGNARPDSQGALDEGTPR